MKKRQTVDRDCVLTADRQLAITVIQQSTPKQSGIHLEVISAKPSFDRNLLKAGCAEYEFIARILHQLPGVWRQPARFSGSPKKKMRIEKQLHRPPSKSRSISELPMVSKSSGMAICPAMKPNRRIFAGGGALSAVTLTRACPPWR